MIKSTFKVTELEEIEEMRKQKEEKKRREALRGSDDEYEDDSDFKVPSLQGEDKPFEVKLGFMGNKIDGGMVDEAAEKEESDEKREAIPH